MKRFVVLSCMLVFVFACSGNTTNQMQSEMDALKKQVAETKAENEKLKKQVEILSNTVKQLSEFNAILQNKDGVPDEPGKKE